MHLLRMQETYSSSMSLTTKESRLKSQEAEMIVMRKDQSGEVEAEVKAQEEAEEEEEDEEEKVMVTEILKLQDLMLKEILILMTQDQREEEMEVEEESMKVSIKRTELEEVAEVAEEKEMPSLTLKVKTKLMMLQLKERNKKFKLNLKSNMKLLDNLTKTLPKLDLLPQEPRLLEKLKVLKMPKS